MKFGKKKIYKPNKSKKIRFIYDNIKKIKNPNIIEFGVRKGVSTEMFLYL